MIAGAAMRTLLHPLGLCAAWLAAGVLSAGTATAADAATELVQRGEYLATAGDCIACHTAPGGKPMAGGLSLATPIGALVSTNITPSKTHGIGNYTLAEFSDALRKGVRADGRHLYPVMPYTAYAKVNDEDMQALYAYFMQAVAPVDSAPPATPLPFPFNLRGAMAVWNRLFLDRAVFVPDPRQSPQWNRGAYLAQGLAHCGTCHTPRNLLMAEKPTLLLGGGVVGAWQAPNITSDVNSGVGGWSEAELLAYLRNGQASGKAQAGGPMAEVIDNSLRHLSEADVRAIAVYLKSVPAQHDPADTQPAYAWGAAGNDLGAIRGTAWPARRDELTGAQLYDAHCATCHQASGQGSFDGGLPPLFHNVALGRANTDNLVLVMLEGLRRHSQGEEVRMPGFAAELTDVQMATLGNYLLQRYGNPKARISAAQVQALRGSAGVSTWLVWAARVGVGLAVLLLVWVATALLRLGRRRTP